MKSLLWKNGLIWGLFFLWSDVTYHLLRKYCSHLNVFGLLFTKDSVEFIVHVLCAFITRDFSVKRLRCLRATVKGFMSSSKLSLLISMCDIIILLVLSKITLIMSLHIHAAGLPYVLWFSDRFASIYGIVNLI